MKNLCSLRQHDLDQVIRVERGSLLSVPHRETPRLIVVNKYNRILRAVNSKIDPVTHHRAHGVHRVFNFSVVKIPSTDWLVGFTRRKVQTSLHSCKVYNKRFKKLLENVTLFPLFPILFILSYLSYTPAPFLLHLQVTRAGA